MDCIMNDGKISSLTSLSVFVLTERVAGNQYHIF